MTATEEKLSLVVPAYNEQECIADCIAELRAVLLGIGRPFEILVVDDGSADETFDILRGLKETMPELRVIRFDANHGQTAAMAAGFEHAQGAIVVTTDADAQNDPADIPTLLDKMNDWDVVCGIRTDRADNFLRRASSRIANAVRNWVTGDCIADTGCTLRAYRREFLTRLKLFEGMHRFLPTLLKLAGARVTEVPVRHRPRLRGQSKYGVWNRLFKGLRDLLAVRWMKKRWLHYRVKETID